MRVSFVALKFGFHFKDHRLYLPTIGPFVSVRTRERRVCAKKVHRQTWSASPIGAVDAHSRAYGVHLMEPITTVPQKTIRARFGCTRRGCLQFAYRRLNFAQGLGHFSPANIVSGSFPDTGGVILASYRLPTRTGRFATSGPPMAIGSSRRDSFPENRNCLSLLQSGRSQFDAWMFLARSLQFSSTQSLLQSFSKCPSLDNRAT